MYVCPSRHSHTITARTRITWGNGSGYPLVVHYWADLQSVPLGKEVGLGPVHIVLDGDPVGTQPPQQPLPTFGGCLLWPNVAHLSNCWALVSCSHGILHTLHFCPSLSFSVFSNPAIFSERELTFTFAICYRPSVCRLLFVCLLSSVTFVRPTHSVQICGNISTALGTLAIHWHPLKISRRSSQGNPSAGRVKHKRGSQV